MMTRFPVIGSRIVMGSPLPFSTGPTPCLPFRSGSLGIVVTGQLLRGDAHILKAGEARMDRLACSVEDC
jgi:hypothetical protein